MMSSQLFRQLSLPAQFDEMGRHIDNLMQATIAEEEHSIRILEDIQRRWNAREAEHKREKVDLKGEISSLQKEIRKLNRQLAESRSALVREVEEKKVVMGERKALHEQIRQVRQLVESKDGLGNSDAHRKRVMKCLDVDRLSPIQSDDSDDCVSGLDYDRTEEDILDPETSRRSIGFEDALENLRNNEQETLILRYLDKGADNDNQQQDGLRRSSRRRESEHRRSHGSKSTSDNNHEKLNTIALDTDSNGMDTDDNNIEYIRQQLQLREAKNMASSTSSPSLKNQNRAATLSSRSAANLMKTMSTISSTPVPALKQHSFVRKKSFKPDSCGPCGGKISFYGNVVKCENCGVTSHPECQDKCPLPCVKITAPNTRSGQKKTLISDYVNNDAVPKVPAIIVHCCNEIEREDNISAEGLYRTVRGANDIEELLQKILKSKSGMPNLSNVDVHLLTNVVKRFLHLLDESLLTTTLWSHFSEAVRLDSDLEVQTHMSYYISYDLPTANRDTLAYLMQHLHAIAKQSDDNKMTKEKLARALAPTIVGNSVRKPAPATVTQRESSTQVQIMEALFKIEEDFWSKFVQKTQPERMRSLGSRMLETPSSSSAPRTRSSTRGGATLPATPKLKSLWSRGN